MNKLFRSYRILLALTLLLSLAVVPTAAADDMWTVANTIIVDVYGKIAGISTVLAGLMSAVAVVGMLFMLGLAQTHLDRLGHHQRHWRFYRLRRSPV